MLRRFLGSIALQAALTLGTASMALTGCDDAAALAKTKSDALATLPAAVEKSKTAAASIEALSKKVDALPLTTPGLGELRSKTASERSAIEGLKTTLTGFPARLDAAASNKEALEVVVRDLGAQVANADSAEKAVDDLTKAEADAEEKGKEAAAAAASAPPPTQQPAEVAPRKLSTGFEVVGAKEGIENQLIDFIADDGKKADKTTWFNFDQLTFKTGGSEIDMDKSKVQLTNIAEILKAYPKVKLKIGGYTDNTGDKDASKKLSQARADAVMKALIASGVAKERLEAEGYGQELPVCAANDTDACKAQNRRIAVRVSEK